MTQDDDQRLVRQCLAGDLHSFDELVVRYQKAIFNLAFRMAGRFDDAEDIAQGAFVKAFERLRSYREDHRFFSWLYRIAVNEALDFLERRKRTGRLEEGRDIEAASAESSAEATDVKDRILEALSKLKVEYRAVVVLKHFEELSYEEIGVILGIPVRKVKSRLFTGRQLLRELLIQRGITSYD